MRSLTLLYVLVLWSIFTISLSVESARLDDATVGLSNDKMSSTERLRDRAKTLRATADDLVFDARSLSDRTTALSQEAQRFITSDQSTLQQDDKTTKRLRQACNSINCGATCLNDCLSQCRVAKVLELSVYGCGRDFCARSCAIGCTADACSFRFILGGTVL